MSRAEPTISIRLLWPFVRLLSADARADGTTLMAGLQLTVGDLVFDQRVPARSAFQTLQRAIEVFGDPMLGLRAGMCTDQGTFGILEHAAAASANLRAAIEVINRHFCVLSEASESWLTVEAGNRACFSYAPLLPHPTAANELVIGAAIGLARRLCSDDLVPLEVWVMHEPPAYADEYAKAWKCPVVFGKHVNALWFDAQYLDYPTRNANANMAAVFEKKAAAVAASLDQGSTISRRVRERLQSRLAAGSVEMAGIARSLRLSTATLRRRLDAEGASYAEILDDVRKEAAERYLLGSELSVTEIGYRLGFSHVRAFARAFRRWTGTSPSDYRGRGDDE